MKEDLSYTEHPITTVDRQSKKLRNKEVASVKVVWEHHQPDEATWESKTDMRARYPHLFVT